MTDRGARFGFMDEKDEQEYIKKMLKPRIASISHTRWAFYEALEADDKESMAGWFETLFHHYQERGKRLRKIRERYEWWEGSRGAYIMSQHYLQELQEYLFRGRSKGLGNHESKLREAKK